MTIFLFMISFAVGALIGGWLGWKLGEWLVKAWLHRELFDPSNGIYVTKDTKKQMRLDADPFNESHSLYSDTLISLFDEMIEISGAGPFEIRARRDFSYQSSVTGSKVVYLSGEMLLDHQSGIFTTAEVVKTPAHEIGHVALGHFDRPDPRFGLKQLLHQQEYEAGAYAVKMLCALGLDERAAITKSKK